MLSEKEVLEIFKKDNALLSGHFLLSSGLHSDLYLEKFQVIKNPWHLEKLCFELASCFSSKEVDAVAGPLTGGMLIAYEVAKNLKTRFMFTEKASGKRILRSAFQINKGEMILVVDDVMTTGGSIQKTIEIIQERGGKVIGVGCLVDRSGGKVEFALPVKSLLKLETSTYPPENCPLCKKGIKLLKPGGR